jgi:hypothetical protein
MRKVFMTLIFTFKKLLSYVPFSVPVGMSQYEKWAAEIIELTNLPATSDSQKFVICTMLLHADSSRDLISKNYFVKRLRKTAANQVVSQALQDLKQKQADEAKLAEDTAKKEQAVTLGEQQ